MIKCILIAIILGLSTGASAEIVPNCVGLEQSVCDSVLSAAGFVPSGTVEYDVAAPGIVFWQSPVQGTNVDLGSVVNYQVSQGQVTPEGYAAQGLIYGIWGIVTGLALVMGLLVGVTG